MTVLLALCGARKASGGPAGTWAPLTPIIVPCFLFAEREWGLDCGEAAVSARIVSLTNTASAVEYHVDIKVDFHFFTLPSNTESKL